MLFECGVWQSISKALAIEVTYGEKKWKMIMFNLPICTKQTYTRSLEIFFLCSIMMLNEDIISASSWNNSLSKLVSVITSRTSYKYCYFDLASLFELHAGTNYLHFPASGGGEHDIYFTTATPLALAVLLLLSLAENQVKCLF